MSKTVLPIVDDLGAIEEIPQETMDGLLVPPYLCYYVLGPSMIILVLASV
jgi:hypothetical protein